MFREFDEGASSVAKVARHSGTGLSEQFENLEKHGAAVSGSAATIQALLDRLQKSPFVTECDALLASLERR